MAAHKGPASSRPRCTRGGSFIAAIPVYQSNTCWCCWCVILRRCVCVTFRKSVYVLNSCWLTKYLCKFSFLGMHRCVGTGHREIWYDMIWYDMIWCIYLTAIGLTPGGSSTALYLFAHSESVRFASFVIFTMLHTWMSQFCRENKHSVLCMTGQVNLTNFSTWSGKVPWTRSLARLHCTDGVGVLWRADSHWRGCHMERSAICSSWWRDLCMR
jgi:hypothetical protein